MKHPLIHVLTVFMGLGLFVTETHAKLAKVSSDTKPVVQKLGQAMKDEASILKKGRSLYTQGKYEEAIKEYSKIPTSSDRWPLAKEEIGWSYLRLKKYEMAVAQTRSLTNAYVKTQINLEPFLLQSIVHLYSCDYPAIFKTLESTRENMTPFVSGMETMAKGQLNEDQQKAIDKLVSDKSFANLKPDEFHVLPRRFYLDKAAASSIKTGNRTNLVRRLYKMAELENKNNHKVLQHLHLVEVEAMQRSFIPNNFGEKRITAVPKDSNLMIFNGDNELWADEVDKTQADLFSCDSKTGRTL